MGETGPDIVVRDARENNLQSVTVVVPRHRLTVVTGPSGSGKSSLAFDTVFAEGQRQYLESLSPFQRRRFDQLSKPAVGSISGLGPTIAVKQHIPGRNPRSTVGSITEMGNLVRLLYSRAGHHTCTGCGGPVAPRTAHDLVDDGVAAIGRGAAVLSRWSHRGPGEPVAPHEPSVLAEVHVDTPPGELREVVRRSVSTAARTPDVVLVVEPTAGAPRFLHPDWICVACGRQATATSSQHFSPNSPEGMCPGCEGLGVQLHVSDDLLIDDPDASIRGGALSFFGDRRTEPKKTYWPLKDLPEILAAFGSSLDTPWRDLSPALQDLVMHGRTSHPVPGPAARFLRARGGYSGLSQEVERLFRSASTLDRKEFYRRYLAAERCGPCAGTRLAPAARAVRLGGEDIAATTARPVSDLALWLDRVGGDDRPALVAIAVKEIEAELRRRIDDVEQVGLGYLPLDRAVPTLSAGEGQRLRIARQLGSTLIDVVYVLDEPSVGLHPADTGRLVDSLRRLRDAGNTVILVEHDADVMRAADHIIDIGPGAGTQGGRVVAAGPPSVLADSGDSATARCLRGEFLSPRAGHPRLFDPRARLVVTGARLHNLRGVTAAFPHGHLTCVTGPSGSGKSTLVSDLVQRAVTTAIETGRVPVGPFDGLDGHQPFRRVVAAAQDPMARNSRSIPATYVGIFDEIRRIFARLPESIARRWSTAHFSYNSEAGQCWTCRGSGEQAMELHFLPDVTVPCPTCRGRRFSDDVLAVRWQGRSIGDVLALDVSTARDVFAEHPRIVSVLTLLGEVGLGYLTLGQNAVTLSGGEAQRLKLARELSRENRGAQCLYILDEPTSGLHASDVAVLIRFLHRLVDAGHSMIVIEHNIDVIAAGDWIVDLGPGSGPAGGEVVAQGPPMRLATDSRCSVAPFLRRVLPTEALSPGRRDATRSEP